MRISTSAAAVFKRAGAWLWAALGLGAILGGYAAALFNEIAPAPQVAKDLVCRWREWRAEPAPGTQFTILISNLARDGDGSQTERVREVFLGQRGLDVRSTCRVVALEAGGGSGADDEAEALAKGRALLEDRNADLLIWGVKKDDKELSLWFLSGGSSTLGEPSYSLTEKLTLPENFEADLGAQLEAVALAQMAPATEQAGIHLVGLLTPVRARLEQLIASPPPGLSDDQKTRLRFARAVSAHKIGEQGGDDEPLEAAVDEYWDVLEVWTRERVPLDWAMTQNNLGLALQTLGEREDGIDRLIDAVAAYRAALEVRTRESERGPLNWAMTQSNLGNVLRALGEREKRSERLEEAVAACRAALEVWTREPFPLDWATAQNNLGLALWRLGEREDGPERLDQAATAFRAALEVYTRERVPLPLDWATIQSNLGNVLSRLGAREDRAERLEQAVAAYDAALEVRTRERVPLDWAKTQNNRGTALRMLGEIEDGTSDAGMGRLEEAIAAYREALKVFRPAGASYYVIGTEANLAGTEALLAERRRRSAAE